MLVQQLTRSLSTSTLSSSLLSLELTWCMLQHVDRGEYNEVMLNIPKTNKESATNLKQHLKSINNATINGKL